MASSLVYLPDPRQSRIIAARNADAPPGRGCARKGKTHAATDADGRFVFATTMPLGHRGYPRHIVCRVSDKDRGSVVMQLHFAPEPGIPAGTLAHLQRDDAGVWRASFGLTMA